MVRTIKKGLLTFLAGILSVSALAMSVQAAEPEAQIIEQDGLSVQIIADQQSYQEEDTALLRTIVTNTNAFGVRSVSLEGILPEGLELAEETNLHAQTELLAAGETLELTVKVKKTAEQPPVSEPDDPSTEEPGGTPPTGEGSILWVIAVLMLLAGGISVVGIKKRKALMKTLSLLFCAGLLIPMAGSFTIQAAEQTKSIEATRSVAFGEKSFSYLVRVSYGAAEQPEIPQDVYQLRLGDAQSEAEAKVVTTGESQIQTVDTSVGSLDASYQVRSLKGLDSSLQFEVSGLPAEGNVVLEMQEIHLRTDAVFAYDVYVNGEKIYTRTYEPLSDGPNHYFIEVDASLLQEGAPAVFRVVNRSESEVRFSNIWTYHDFSGLMEEQNVYRPMEVGLFTPKLSYEDYEADLALVKEIQAAYSGYEMYTLGMGFDFLYLHLEEKELQERLDYLMNLSADTGIPVHLSVNSWWGGTPHGFDGKGGMWTDLEYNQVVYDPLNLEDRGEWRLSTPNQWSNTPWLTMNSDYYNQVREEKVAAVTAYISEKSGEYRAKGVAIPPVTVFTENEPLYWPYSAFEASPDARADFSYHVMEAARRDGVELNPEDGLSDQEKLWMYKNLNTYIDGVGQAMARGLGHDAVVVDNGKITYPDYQLVENAYSHMFIRGDDPIPDLNQAIWENHMLDSIRFGGEWAEKEDDRYLDYIAARGKFGDVNSERGSMNNSDFSMLQQAYAHGSNHVTIYNYLDGDQALIAATDQAQDETMPVRSYNKTLFIHSFNTNKLQPEGNLVAMQGVRTEPLGFQYVLCPDNGEGEESSVTFQVTNENNTLANGLAVKLDGRILSNYSENCRIEVYAGASQEAMEKVLETSSIPANAIDVSQAIDKTADAAYVELVLHGHPDNSTLYSWTALKSVMFQSPWAFTSGQTSGEQPTYRQMRERNLWIGYRADVERMLRQYEEKAGQDEVYQEIKALYDGCRYVSAYNRLIEALSETLPAKYAVKGGGQLGRYPVEIALDQAEDIVNVTLLEVGEQLRFQVLADQACNVTLSWEQKNSGTYRLAHLGDGVYELSPAVYGSITAQDGKLTVQVQASPYYNKDYPSSFTASFDSVKDGKLYVQSQNPEIGEYANAVSLEVAEDAIITRGKDGTDPSKFQKAPLSALIAGDKLDLRLDDNDVVVEIRATYGAISGDVVSVEYPKIKGSASNAFITIRSADGKTHRFEIGSEAVFDYPTRTGTNLLTAKLDDYGLSEGDHIKVLYSPYLEKRTVCRVLKLTQPFETLINETFEQDGWQEKAYEVNNVTVNDLDSNFHAQVARPEDLSKPGFITWKFDNRGEAFGQLHVQYSGRSIMGSTLKWYMSTDNTTWELIADNLESGEFSTMQDILLEDIAADVVYLKCEFTSGFDTWGSLNDVIIRKQASEKELVNAELTVDATEVDRKQSIPYAIKTIFDDGSTADTQGMEVEFIFSKEGILEQAEGALNAVGAGDVEVYAVIRNNGAVAVTNTVSIHVNPIIEIEWNPLLDYNFEDLEEFTTEIPGVLEAENIQVEKLEAVNGFNDQGICGTLDPDGTEGWEFRKAAYAVYEINAPEGTTFQHLQLQYAGRSIMGAQIKFLVSEDNQSWQDAGAMPADHGSFSEVLSQDLTEWAKGKSKLYLKIEFTPTRYTWGWINQLTVLNGIETGDLT